MTKWIIPADPKEYKGYALSTLTERGTVAYTEGLTLDEYIEREGPVRVVDDDEFFKIADSYLDSRCTKPKRTTKAHYWDMLEILPPDRFEIRGKFTSFHVCERITGDLVNWYFTDGKRYWTFVHHDSLSDKQLTEYMRNVTKGA